MLDDLSSIISFALVVAAVVSIGGLGYLRGSLSNVRGQLADADREIRVLKEQRTDDRATITTQAADIAALQRTVTGEVHLLAIAAGVKNLHEQAQEHWNREEEMHSEVLAALRGRGGAQ